MSTQHAKHFSASASSRWLNCTASVQLYAERKETEDKGSIYAQEGTRAHEVADLCLCNDRAADYYIGHDIEEGVVTKDMTAYVQEYLDYVQAFQTSTTMLFPEQQVDYSDYVPDGFGTSDAIIIDTSDHTCHIFDLKYGKGVSVDAKDNTQAQLYALGVISDYGFIHPIENVVIHIVQPRTGNYSYWERTPEQLHEFGKFAQLKAEEAFSDDAQYKPSDKACQWCKFKGVCKALLEHTHNVISQEFTDLTEDHQQISTMSDDELRLVHTNAKLIRGFLDAVESHIKHQLEAGQTFTGYKLVEGRSIRKLTSEATTKLKDNPDCWENKLLTLGKLEKLFGKKDFAALDITSKPPGKPTVVPESDKRKSIDVTQDFEKIN